MPLQTRNVFIDTQVFVKAGLDFTSRTIASFVEICSQGGLNHITTEVVTSEVAGKIKEHIQEALNGAKEFRRKAKILSASTEPSISNLFVEIDNDQVQHQAQEVFQGFLENSNTTVLNLSNVDSARVFAMYFGQQAPFQEGKKKSEFPDAFSLLAVEGHLKGEEEVYVVSEDGDLIAFCKENKRFVSIDSIGKLLDLYNSHDEQRADFIKGYIEQEKSKIQAVIKEQVNGADFYNNSTWEDAELNEHDVISVDDFEPEIIHIDDEECQIAFDVSVNILLKVTGPDFNNGTYDSEDKRLYTFGDATREEEQSVVLSVEIDLFYSVRNENFEVSDMDIRVLGLTSGIEVSVEENSFEY